MIIKPQENIKKTIEELNSQVIAQIKIYIKEIIILYQLQQPTPQDAQGPKALLIMWHSASGKDTLIQHFTGYPRILRTTTRKPRIWEINWDDYFFVPEEGFWDPEKYCCYELHPTWNRYGIAREHVYNVIEKQNADPTTPIVCIAWQITDDLLKIFTTNHIYPHLVFLYCDPQTMIDRLCARHQKEWTKEETIITDISARLLGAISDFERIIKLYNSMYAKQTHIPLWLFNTAVPNNTPGNIKQQLLAWY